MAEWRLLAVLARFGPLSANSVADRSAMDKVRVSRAVARATANGLIERRIDTHDRRRAVLTLTPEGRAVHDRLLPLVRLREAEILAILTSAELASFNEITNRLLIHAVELEREASLPKAE